MAHLCESCMRENCTCSLGGGRRPARKRASSDPTPWKSGNADGGKEPWFKAHAGSNKEPRLGQPYTTRVVSGVVKCMPADRRKLLEMRCKTDLEVANFRGAIEKLVKATTGDELRPLDAGTRRPWDDSDVPVQVTRKTCDLGAVPPTEYEWRALTPLQRFALIKLSRDGDHHRNLIPALQEFNLYS
jgi:hypothetical protein